MVMKMDLISLGADLVGRGVISRSRYARTRNPYVSDHDRAADLVQSLQESVYTNTEYYYTFIDILEQSANAVIFGPIKEELESVKRGLQQQGIL